MNTHNTSLVFLKNGKEVIDTVFSLIESAQSSIVANFYDVQDDEIGKKFISLLENKAKQGKDVTLIYDLHGSFLTSNDVFENLKKAGAYVHKHNPYSYVSILRFIFMQIRSNHHKLLVIDGQSFIIGGVNIGLEYYTDKYNPLKWLDFGMLVHCQDTSANILQVLADQFFKNTTHHLKKILLENPQQMKKNWKLFWSDPILKKNKIHTRLIQMIQNAKNEIFFFHAYFLPHGKIVFQILDALKRGVSIKILIPDRYESIFIKYTVYAHIDVLLKNSTPDNKPDIRVWKGKVHSKLTLADNSVFLGSCNLDYRSLYYNFESNLLVHDAVLVKDIKTVIEDMFTQSEPYQIRSKNIFRSIFLYIFRIFGKLI